MTWTLSPDEVDATRTKHAKINDRAAKRGFTGRLTLTTTPTTWTETTPTGSHVTRHGFKAAIDGDAPCYGGHRFLGVVTPVEGTDATVIFRAAPGVEDVDLTTLKANIVECCTMYGVTHLVTVFTDGGVVKTFTTARWLTDVNTGDRVTMTGTVKAHGEYEGRRETTLTRTKAQVVSH